MIPFTHLLPYIRQSSIWLMLLIILPVIVFGQHNEVSYSELHSTSRHPLNLYTTQFFVVLCSLMVFLSLTSASQFAASRDRSYLYYSLFTGLNFAYYFLLYHSIPGTNVLFSLEPFWFSLLGHLLLLLGYAFYIRFGAHILDLAQDYPKTYGLFQVLRKVIFGLILCTILVDIPAMYYFHSNIPGICILVAAMVAGLTGICAIWMIRGKIARMIAIGTSIYFAASLLGFFFSSEALRPFIMDTILNHPICFTGTGSLIESLLFFTALGYRHRNAIVEKIKAFQQREEKTQEILQLMEANLQERTRIARDLHDELGSTLSSISILSGTTQEQLPKEEILLRLRQISQRTQNVQEAMSDIVWSVNPANDSMESVLIHIREFAVGLIEPLDWELSFSFEADLGRQKLDHEQRQDFYLICKEALNNAAKYAHARYLSVRAGIRGENIWIEIEDDGIGFDGPSVKMGNGLNNMSARAKKLGGTFEIKSTPAKGTRVCLSFPVT